MKDERENHAQSEVLATLFSRRSYTPFTRDGLRPICRMWDFIVRNLERQSWTRRFGESVRKYSEVLIRLRREVARDVIGIHKAWSERNYASSLQGCVCTCKGCCVSEQTYRRCRGVPLWESSAETEGDIFITNNGSHSGSMAIAATPSERQRILEGYGTPNTEPDEVSGLHIHVGVRSRVRIDYPRYRLLPFP